MEQGDLTASAPEEPKLKAENQKKKKKKKRKREAEADDLEGQSESAQSHLEPHQDDDWCLGETWSISSAAKGDGFKLSEVEEIQQTKPQSVPEKHSNLKKKKKKKKHKLGEELEDLKNGAASSKW